MTYDIYIFTEPESWVNDGRAYARLKQRCKSHAGVLRNKGRDTSGDA